MSNFTPDHLRRLELAIVGGQLEVQYEDRRTRYRSLDEMIQIRDLVRRELGVTGTAGARSRKRLASFGKGLG